MGTWGLFFWGYLYDTPKYTPSFWLIRWDGVRRHQTRKQKTKTAKSGAKPRLSWLWFTALDGIRRKKTAQKIGCFFTLVPTMRLELIRPRVTTPSRQRVYQFHHVGINFKLSFYCCGEEPLFCSEDCPAGCCWVCAGWLCSTVLKSKPWLFALVWI